MAKSIIVQQFLSNQISLQEVMERLLYIVIGLNDGATANWIKNELYGYKSNSDTPEYRVFSLTPMGSYLVGNLHYQNMALMTIGVPDDLLDAWNHHHHNAPLSTITSQIEAIKGGNKIMIPIPPEFFVYFNKNTNGHVTNANLLISEFDLENIVAQIRTRVIELLSLLETNLGCLDDFDAGAMGLSSKEQENLKGAMSQVINHGSITTYNIVTRKSIKKSRIGSNNDMSNENKTDVQSTVNIGEKKESWFKRIFKRLFRL